MELANYAVTAVLIEGRSVRDVAASTGRSKSWVHRHVQLFREGGEAALVPMKTGPKVSPRQTPPEVEDAIVALRKQLRRSRDRPRHARHQFQTRQALPSPNPGQGRAISPHLEEVAQASTRCRHDVRTSEPDRFIRPLLQREATAPGEGVPSHARVAHTRQGHARPRRPTDSRQDQSATRPRRSLGVSDPALPAKTAPHQRRARPSPRGGDHLDGGLGCSRRLSGGRTPSPFHAGSDS